MPATPEPSGQHVSLFATTRWSIVGAAAGDDDSRARDGLALLFEVYWPPLYRYVRRLGRVEQDAEDLVQGFFVHLLEGQGLRLADRDRGRFRAFLLGSLKNYMANEWQRDHRQKRGGFAPHLSIDWQDAESGLALESADERSPDKLFDREWALALLDKVLSDLAAEEEDFVRWKPFLSVSSERISYAGIAAEFAMTEGAARVAVHRLRKRYRHRLREEIARTLASDDLVDDEMQALFAVLSE
ncbi:RNA polymerase sigma factor [Luteolibacter sp. Populi]|uniref:RNA polymerase sigma factor n=1 Tax=Luteolibacter sp. Populi TaxID=3230487 RepID=UPI003465EFCD